MVFDDGCWMLDGEGNKKSSVQDQPFSCLKLGWELVLSLSLGRGVVLCLVFCNLSCCCRVGTARSVPVAASGRRWEDFLAGAEGGPGVRSCRPPCTAG